MLGKGLRVIRGPVAFPAVSPWIEAVLWHGLDDRPVPTESFDAALGRIIDQRLAPLALAYLRRHSVLVSEDTMRRLRRSDFAWSALGLSVTIAGADVQARLSDAGIVSVLFKGPAIRRCYAVPRSRLYSDIDLLVDPRDYRRARKLMLGWGWAEDLQSVLPYDAMNFWCREAQNLKAGPGESVDLHHHLPPWLWTRRVDLRAIVADSCVINGQRAMGAEWNLLVASLHLVSDRSKPGQTLIIWRDLAELSRAVDAQRMAELAADARLGPWVRAVLEALPGSLCPVSVVDALPTGRLAHPRRLSLLSNPRLVGRRIPVVQLFRLPMHRALLYAAGMLLPPPAFIRRRYTRISAGYREWWTGPDGAVPPIGRPRPARPPEW